MQSMLANRAFRPFLYSGHLLGNSYGRADIGPIAHHQSMPLLHGSIMAYVRTIAGVGHADRALRTQTVAWQHHLRQRQSLVRKVAQHEVLERRPRAPSAPPVPGPS